MSAQDDSNADFDIHARAPDGVNRFGWILHTAAPALRAKRQAAAAIHRASAQVEQSKDWRPCVRVQHPVESAQ